MEAELIDCCNCRSSRAKFIVTVVIIGVGWWDCMPKNLALSITAHANMGVTCYERGEDEFA